MSLTIDDLREMDEHMKNCKFEDKLDESMQKDIEKYKDDKLNNPDNLDYKKVGFTTSVLLDILLKGEDI